MRRRAIIVGAKDVPIAADVEHGLTFHTAKARTGAAPDLLVLHDTAGEGDGARVHNTLKQKGLSIHFVVSKDGTIWQYLDPLLQIAGHAGKGNNSRSVGIEISNIVFAPGMAPGKFVNTKVELGPNVQTYGRPIIVDGYRGGKRRVLGHHAAQITAVRELVRVLLDNLPSIPRRLPRIGTFGDHMKVHGDRVPAGWQGVAGHLHLTDAHVDPAMDVLYALDGDLP